MSSDACVPTGPCGSMTDRPPVVTVVAGTGEHADPWHALPAVASAVAELLDDIGDVRVTTIEARHEWRDCDLLVLVVGGDLATPAPRSGPFVDLVVHHHRSGKPLIALHSAALAFRDDPRWQEVLGGRWVPGRSSHPQIGHALIQTTPALSVPDGLVAFAGDFVLYDERYSFLETHEVTVLARHTEDGCVHPLVWGRPASADRGVVVYDGLGHGVESLASSDHARWLVATARALLGAKRTMFS